MIVNEETQQQILKWLANGRIGVSSKVIAMVMLGQKAHIRGFDRDVPHDPADFCRCLKLLQRAPEIRSNLKELKSVSKKWDVLVDNWDRVEKAFMDEAAGWLDDSDTSTVATKTYSLLKELYKSVQ